MKSKQPVIAGEIMIEAMNQPVTYQTFFLTTLIANVVSGQQLDSAQIDLARLSDVDFFKKYSVTYGEAISLDDIQVTKLIWSLSQVRQVDNYLRTKGVRTFTMIVERPSKKNRYYLIGHYQLPTPDHLTRMSYYRVGARNKMIEYQDLDDFANDLWKKVQ